jgi:hypothetical protein
MDTSKKPFSRLDQKEKQDHKNKLNTPSTATPLIATAVHHLKATSKNLFHVSTKMK